MPVGNEGQAIQYLNDAASHLNDLINEFEAEHEDQRYDLPMLAGWTDDTIALLNVVKEWLDAKTGQVM